jgi:hypothetical protein
MYMQRNQKGRLLDGREHMCVRDSTRARPVPLNVFFKFVDGDFCQILLLDVPVMDWPNYLYFFVVLGCELRAYTSSHSTSPFL